MTIEIQRERERAASLLDAAITVQQITPSPENERVLRKAGERYVAAFYAEQAGAYIARTTSL